MTQMWCSVQPHVLLLYEEVRESWERSNCKFWCLIWLTTEWKYLWFVMQGTFRLLLRKWMITVFFWWVDLAGATLAEWHQCCCSLFIYLSPWFLCYFSPLVRPTLCVSSCYEDRVIDGGAQRAYCRGRSMEERTNGQKRRSKRASK